MERSRPHGSGDQRAEAEVDRLEKEKAELALAFSNPAEGASIASVGRRLQQVQYEIDSATGKWEKATEELEKVMEAAGGMRSKMEYLRP